MGWINLEAFKKLTTERPKKYLSTNQTALKSNNISYISSVLCRTTIKRGQVGQQQLAQIYTIISICDNILTTIAVFYADK